jgi:hemerythrin-like metal-binding protein
MPFHSAIGRSTSGLSGLSRYSLKQLITWGDHLKIDHPQIDAQHEAIFHIALEIADISHAQGDPGQLRALAEKLNKVLEAHFKYEEQQLADIGYTKLAQHQAEHAVMLDELQVIRERLNSFGDRPIQQGPGFLIMNFVLGVTVGHITDSDMEYCAFARRAAIGERQRPVP